MNHNQSLDSIRSGIIFGLWVLLVFSFIAIFGFHLSNSEIKGVCLGSLLFLGSTVLTTIELLRIGTNKENEKILMANSLLLIILGIIAFVALLFPPRFYG